MAAYAALVSLLNSIHQITNHPLLSTSLDKNQIQPLVETARSLLGFIEGYDYGGPTSKEVEDLERRIASAAHAAEDAVESFVVDRIRAGKDEARRSLDLHQIIEDMNTILKEANELKEKEGLRLSEEEQPTPMETVKSGKMVGFEEEMIQLMDELTNQRSSRAVVSIVGMGGSGKTTLGKTAYENSFIKQHFDFRAWATLSQQCNVKGTLSQLLPGKDGRTVADLGLELHQKLYGRRYLIMLDDVWSVEAWEEVRHFFPDNGNGSRVVLTTRVSSVARDCDSSSSFTMKPLDERKSWELFCKNAFKQENCPFPALVEVGEEIARLCRGLPLSIVVIGGFLHKSPSSLRVWKNVVANVKSNPDSKEKRESLDILSLSYNYLPPRLKPCFLYMGVFKEDSEIRVSKIIKLWIAEGLILRPKNAHMVEEEIAEGYVKELVDRNLIFVRKHGHNGMIGSCGIHDLLRDLCLKISEQQEFLHPVNKGELVRVWDEGYLESPVESLFGKNVNLRYIAFRPFCNPSTMTKLPSSISLVWNLQTLIVKYSWSDTLVVAPVEIWKMRQLRHLKFSKIHLPHPPSGDGSFTMDNLQTLTTAVNLRLSEQVCKIIPNIKKLHLAYSDKWEGYEDGLIGCLCNIDRFHKLESLSLSVENLDMKQDKTITFPVLLNKLFLSGSVLGWDYLWMVGSLPRLQVLKLLGNRSDEGNEWSPGNEQFLGLKCLEIALCDLSVLNAESFHFPVLEKLVLIGLLQLEEIPLDIGEIPTLEVIRVDYCSESAAISAVKIKEDQVEKQGDDGDVLQVHVCMFKSQFEGFMERVKKEGLTTHNIHLPLWLYL